MFNTLLCENGLNLSFDNFGDKVAESGIVVLIGITLVFAILLFLIVIVSILRSLNGGLNKWDVKMAVVRADKAERKAIKEHYINKKEELINEIIKLLDSNQIDEAESKKRIAKINADYKASKPAIKAEIAEKKAQQVSARKSSNTVVAPVVIEDTADINDERIIAVITAAIAVATEQECVARKIKFKVRSIKEIK